MSSKYNLCSLHDDSDALIAKVTQGERFYSDEHSGTFWAKTPEEFLVDKFDAGVLDVALASYVKGVEVVEYQRVVVSDQWLESATHQALDDFDESYADEFGGEDDDCKKPGADEAPEREELFHLLKRYAAKHLRPFCCEAVSTRTYSREEVRAILAAHLAKVARTEG